MSKAKISNLIIKGGQLWPRCFHTNASPNLDSTNQLLNSELHEALKGFRIEEIYDHSLLKEVIQHQEQE